MNRDTVFLVTFFIVACLALAGIVFVVADGLEPAEPSAPAEIYPLDYVAEFVEIKNDEDISITYSINRWTADRVIGTERFGVRVSRAEFADCVARNHKDVCINELFVAKLTPLIRERIGEAREFEEYLMREPSREEEITKEDIETLLTDRAKRGE